MVLIPSIPQLPQRGSSSGCQTRKNFATLKITALIKHETGVAIVKGSKVVISDRDSHCQPKHPCCQYPFKLLFQSALYGLEVCQQTCITISPCGITMGITVATIANSPLQQC